MRPRRFLALSASATLLALAACTSIAGLSGDFSPGLDGSVAPGADGVAPGVDGSKGDGQVAQSDGHVDTDSTTDPGTDAGIDTGLDTGPPFDAAPPTELTNGGSLKGWCNNGPSPGANAPAGDLTTEWCWDFDAPASPPNFGAWSEAFPPDGTGLSLVDGSASGFHSVRALATGSANDLDAVIGAPPKLPANFNPNHGYDFRFKFRVVSAATYVSIAAVQFWGQQEGLAVYPGGCSAVDCLGENAQNGRNPSTITPPGTPTAFDSNAWYQARITVMRASPGWSSQIMVGDKIISQRTGNAMPDTSPGGEDQARLVIGAFGNAAGQADIRIDDTAVYAF